MPAIHRVADDDSAVLARLFTLAESAPPPDAPPADLIVRDFAPRASAAASPAQPGFRPDEWETAFLPNDAADGREP
jgi:hypothetical protein